MSARIIPFRRLRTRPRLPDLAPGAEHTHPVPARFRALANAVCFQLGQGPDAREAWLTPDEADQWARWFTLMATTARTMTEDDR